MAERKAVNKYYPPDWDPSMGSLNKYRKTRPSDNQPKRDKGEAGGGRTVRFEMPFDVYCQGCNNLIGMGVRYNAKKVSIGEYYTSVIWRFRMKCHQCPNWIEIHTDPKNADYFIASGATKRTVIFDPKDAQVMELKDDAHAEKLATNPFFKLEHQLKDEKVGKAALPTVSALQRLNERQWKDPFAMSQLLRSKFRTEKKRRNSEIEETNSLKNRMSLNLNLLPKSEVDSKKAKSTKFNQGSLQEKKEKIKNSSIFPDSNRTKLSALLPDPFAISNSLPRYNSD